MITPTIIVNQVIVALGAFINPFVTPNPIVRGQVNRVPPPLTGYVLLTEMRSIDLETPTGSYDDLSLTLSTPTQIDIQADFYGPSSGDQIRAVKSVFRSVYATSQFPDGIKPLYCSDGNQSPLVTGEEQYEQRWTMTVSLQYNPVIAISQQSANALAMNIFQEII
jgi:hypothetical protein